MSEEVWKDIIGLEGLYQISNKGNVRSVDREQKNKNGVAVRYKGKRIKPQPNSAGYLRVELKANGKTERCFVHRLVAKHFVGNALPEINIVVNHIDSNPHNNDATNLEWTTYKGNSQHALKAGRLNRTEKWIANLNKGLERHYKAVEAYDPYTKQIVHTFKNLLDCRWAGFEPSCVCQCCKDKRKTHRGLAWRYANG